MHTNHSASLLRSLLGCSRVSALAGLVALVAALGAGCGDDDGMPPPAASCNAGSTGETMCAFGSSVCGAGQFCEDDAFCEPGCTSDANCLAGDRCVRAAGEAVGSCAPCSPPPPTTNADAGPVASDSITRCEAAFMRAFDCGLIDNAELAGGQDACTSVLTESERNIFAGCVEAAAGCGDVETCVGGGSDGSCVDDAECDTTPGLSHEICSGGLCVIGCRFDGDCGNDYECDDFANACFPIL